jgi:hypothetical protein
MGLEYAGWDKFPTFTRVEVAFLVILAYIPDPRLCPVMLNYDRVLRHFLRQFIFTYLDVLSEIKLINRLFGVA